MIAVPGITADRHQILSLYETEESYSKGEDPIATLFLIMADESQNNGKKADQIVGIVRRVINEKHKEPL